MVGTKPVRRGVFLALLILIPVAALADEKPRGMSMVTSMPGSGFGINERGQLDPGGATTLNVPLGYTLSAGQQLLGLWGGSAGGEGFNLQAGLSLGMLGPAQGLSVTGVWTDTHDPVAYHVQKQLWGETASWPALSVGVLDANEDYEGVGRSYYLSATKRLGTTSSAQAVLRAAAPAWPPGPVPPSAGNPASWGTAFLSGQRLGAGAATTASDRLSIPLSAQPPALDGMLGTDWEDAAQVRLTLTEGQYLFLGAKHTGGTLYVVAAVPSDRGLTPGSEATLYLEMPRSASRTLTSHHRSFRLVWGPEKDETVRYAAASPHGRWEYRRVEADDRRPPLRFTGIVSESGDGAWRYPVFEFAIPLSEIDVAEGDEIGFAVSVNLPAESPRPPQTRSEATDLVRWPLGRTVYTGGKSSSFGTHPDQWGDLVMGPRTRGDGRLGAPEVAQAPVLDGRLAEGEWKGADSRTSELASGVSQTLYVQRSTSDLCLALVSRSDLGTQRDQVVEVYLDPDGDEGLWPRSDDLLLRITQAQPPKLEAFRWNEGARRWTTRAEVDFEAATASNPTRTGFESVTELAIPLRYLQARAGSKTPAALRGTLGLGVETLLTTNPARVARGAAGREKGAGESTFVTLGWGTGIYHDRAMGGLSHPVGSFRGTVEYDGDQLNMGLTGGLFGSRRARLTVGYNGVNSTPDGGPLVGLSFTDSF